MIEYLLWKGASVELRDERGTTELMMAAHVGHLSIAEYMVRLQADVNAADHEIPEHRSAIRCSERAHCGRSST